MLVWRDGIRDWIVTLADLYDGLCGDDLEDLLGAISRILVDFDVC